MDLRKLVRDSGRMQSGEWVGLGAEWMSIEVCVKALSHDYNDKLAQRNRLLARSYNGREIPSAETASAVVETLIETSLLGVRGPDDLTLDGKKLTMETFCDLLREPGSAELVNAVILATNRVGRNAIEDRKEAKGN